jgi:hypothetical protein
MALVTSEPQGERSQIRLEIWNVAGLVLISISRD